MRFRVKVTRREGWTLPRHMLAFKPPIAGQLVMLDALRPSGHRNCRIATLQDIHAAGTELLPRLYDAQVISIREDYMLITGFELIHQLDRQIQYGQAWQVTPSDPEDWLEFAPEAIKKLYRQNSSK